MKKIVFLAIISVLSIQISQGQSAVKITKNGSGKPILFLPGFTTPGSVWDEAIAKLNDTYETHTVSYAGFNGIEPIGTPWYLPIKEQLVDYIDKQQLHDLTIIGHSMGGNLATELAAAFNEQVTGLIIVDALPCMREVMMPGVPANALQYDSPFNNQLLALNDEAFGKMAQNMATNMTNDSSKIADIASWSIAADRKTYVYGYTDLLKLDLRPVLAKITTETLILGATFPTKEISQQTFEKQYTNLKNKTIKLADNSRHFIMFDRPEWFYTQVNNYLAEHAQ